MGMPTPLLVRQATPNNVPLRRYALEFARTAALRRSAASEVGLASPEHRPELTQLRESDLRLRGRAVDRYASVVERSIGSDEDAAHVSNRAGLCSARLELRLVRLT